MRVPEHVGHTIHTYLAFRVALVRGAVPSIEQIHAMHRALRET